VSRFYAIDEANATLPDLERILGALREQREELVTARDRTLSLTPEDGAVAPEAAEELRLIRLRMQGLIDQMQAGVARLVEMDITLRDIQTGLIDFPALVSGRPIWLCWRLGEPEVGHWHGQDEGFSSRRPLDELPASRGSGTLA
jgi:hypothetical protein